MPTGSLCVPTLDGKRYRLNDEQRAAFEKAKPTTKFPSRIELERTLAPFLPKGKKITFTEAPRVEVPNGHEVERTMKLNGAIRRVTQPRAALAKRSNFRGYHVRAQAR